MAIVVFADAHVQERAWAARPLYGDSFWALEQVVSGAIGLGATAVIGAGDLLDQQRNRSSPITFWYRQLSRLQAAKIPFFYVEGQHDQDTPPWLSGHANAFSLHRRTVVLDGWKVYGVNFCRESTLLDELRAVPADTDLLVCHQAWQEWVGPSGQASLADLPDVPWVFTGDFHDHRVEKHGRRTVCSPGSLAMQSLNEPRRKGYFVLDRKTGLSWKPIRSRPFVRLRFTNVETVRERLRTVLRRLRRVTESLPEPLQLPLIVVEEVPGPQEEAMLASFGDQAHLVFRRRRGPAPEPALAVPVGSENEAVASALADLDPEARELAQALWGCVRTGRDVQELLDAWVEKFRVGT